MMMLKSPVYYVAAKKGVNDKSSASLGLTVCFAILTALLLIKNNERDAFYYIGLVLTLLFALLMVWRMNMKDSRINVRKTFTASTVVLLTQSVIAAVLISDASNKHQGKTALQAVFITMLLAICVYRLISFLRQREAIEKELTESSSVEEE
jgi:FtsH-binding integral membrane protein